MRENNRNWEYYLGLNVGPNYVGWAVSAPNYALKKFNGKHMWGMKLFDSNKTAEERRIHRSTKRRNERKKQRIQLLQEIFAQEIFKVDPSFFQRMNESRLHMEDRSISQPNALFNDESYADRDYFQEYPTTYHLRKDLIHNAPKDIRHLYLALHHILKSRGHFLFEGVSFNDVVDFDVVFSSLAQIIEFELGLDISYIPRELLGNVIKDSDAGLKEKKSKLKNLSQTKNKQILAIMNALCGANVKLSAIFDDKSLNENEGLSSIQFGQAAFEDQYEQLQNILNDRIVVLDALKSVFDWGALQNILQGHSFLSEAKVDGYLQHKDDLALLKRMTREHLPEKFNEIFLDTDKGDNYVAYVGKTKINSTKVKGPGICSQEDFLKYLEKTFKKVESTNPEFEAMVDQITSGSFIPKQKTNDNATVPYQVHLSELEEILRQAKAQFSFLSEVDSTGYSAAEKIKMIFLFRVPYFVGPLNDAHKQKDVTLGNCWITKKPGVAVRPWNFNEVVDLEQSATDFIGRRTGKCTYLIGADVLPRNSLLYSEFAVLNELNSVRVDGQKLPNDVRTRVIEALFKKNATVTTSALSSYLKNHEDITGSLTGVSKQFTTSLAAYIKLSKIFNTADLDVEMAENIILWITIFGKNKSILRKRIERQYGSIITEEQLSKLCNLSFSGWGKLSEEFLTSIHHTNKNSGEMLTIIDVMRARSLNLMEVLTADFDFKAMVEEKNNSLFTGNGAVTYEDIKDLYVSPKIRRSIWQALQISDEITSIIGKDPQKIFVKVNQEPPTQSSSRKAKLIGLYSSYKKTPAGKKDSRDWVAEITALSESQLKSNRVYLYYMQMGRCMYSSLTDPYGALKDPLDMEQCNLDHIYPKMVVVDSGIDNTVLVRKSINQEKSHSYPLEPEIQKSALPFWKVLLDNKFISHKKFNRLTRIAPFDDKERAAFIASAVTEDRQAAKATSQMIRRKFPESYVAHVKPRDISAFRQQFDLFRSTETDDTHYAKDAYLGIVAGNVHDVKFTRNPLNFIKSGAKYNLNRKYDFRVERGSVIAWVPGKNGSIETVRRFMRKNTPIYTRYPYESKGDFFKLLPKRRGVGQFPLKPSDPALSSIEKYGGYDSVYGAYFSLVEYKDARANLLRRVMHVPRYLSKQVEADMHNLEDYFCQQLQVDNVEILLPKIKVDSLIRIDKVPYHLTGRTGDQLVIRNAVQLSIPYEDERYLRKVFKFHNKVQAVLKTSKDKELIVTPTPYDGVSKESNLALFDVFHYKITSTIYSKMFKARIKKLDTGRDLFKKLSVASQCAILTELTLLFQCKKKSANLTLIGDVNNADLMKINSAIIKNGKSKFQEILLINQSPTGLFQTEVDLLQL